MSKRAKTGMDNIDNMSIRAAYHYKFNDTIGHNIEHCDIRFIAILYINYNYCNMGYFRVFRVWKKIAK